MRWIQDIFLFLFLSVFGLGCGIEIQDRDSEVGDQHEAPRDLIPLEGPGFRIEEGENPREYKVHLSLSSSSLYLERLEIEGLQTSKRWTLKASEGVHPAFIDADVESGRSYEYRIFTSISEKPQVVRVQVPRDEQVTSLISLKSLAQGPPIRRLYLGPQAILQSEDEHLELRSELLVAERGALLRTFPDGQTAEGPAGVGRSGGLIKIRLKRAVGDLRIEMRGENGGRGKAGEAQSPAADGVSIPPRPSSPWSLGCRDVRPGGPGQNGAPGLPGGAGGPGGHSGSLDFDVDDASQFRWTVEFIPGSGGEGGAGGPGQPGGKPGLSEVRVLINRQKDEMGERIERESPCPIPPAGPPGEAGPKGKVGDPGQGGRKGRLCHRKKGVCSEQIPE